MTRIYIDHFEVHRVGIAEAERRVREVVRSVEIAAKIATSTGPYSYTKELSRSIRSGFFVARTVVHAEVGSDVSYARIVHNGAEAHIIRPRALATGIEGLYGSGGSLRFYWRKVGKYVAFRKVNHPGQRGKFFLTRPLEVAGRRYGFKVTTFTV